MAALALDAQSNWDVEMSKPRRLSLDKSFQNMSLADNSPLYKADAREIPLPIEIILQILSYIPRRSTSQPLLWSCCLINRAWYQATIPFLYDRPYISGHNFQEFVRTVCPSKNAHIRQSQLAVLVHRLDMGNLVHDGSKSLTARLLGRLKQGLEVFVAPQASFAINSFASLSKCVRLKHLDLSLISASISMQLLFQTLKRMDSLETLFLPRSSSHAQETEAFNWPPALKALHLAGGVDDFFLRRHVINVPPCLQTLSIQSCPMVYVGALQDTLQILGPQLKELTIIHPMNRLHQGALDHTLAWCPNLIALRVSADYISRQFFDVESIPKNHALRILDLDCSSFAGVDIGVDVDEIYNAIDEERLPDLRSVRVSARLAWTATRDLTKSVRDLAELLETMEKEKPLGIEAGVWTIAG